MDTYRSSSSSYGQTDTSNRSLIDRNSHFDGLYKTSADLLVEGRADGEVECEGTLTIAEGASLEATVSARMVVIAGTAKGRITCSEQFVLKPTGRITGKVSAASILVEEGAYFEGEFRMAQGGSTPSFNESDADAYDFAAATDHAAAAETSTEVDAALDDTEDDDIEIVVDDEEII